jgi:hypothetical protein
VTRNNGQNVVTEIEKFSKINGFRGR